MKNLFHWELEHLATSLSLNEEKNWLVITVHSKPDNPQDVNLFPDEENKIKIREFANLLLSWANNENI